MMRINGVIHKKCCACEELKPLDCFYYSKTGIYKKGGNCKSCCIKLSIEWRNKNREKHRENDRKSRTNHMEKNKYRNKEWRLKNKDKLRWQLIKCKYRLSKEDWMRIFEKQGNCCGICGLVCESLEEYHTDHDHKTGIIRGILCMNCNLIMRDVVDVKYLSRCINYLLKVN